MSSLVLPSSLEIRHRRIAASTTKSKPDFERRNLRHLCHFEGASSKSEFEALKHQIIRLSSRGRLKEAFDVFHSMSHHDLVIYSVLLKSCIRLRDFRRGRLLHAHLLQSNIEWDSVLSNSLISFYSKFGDWEMGHEIFEHMSTKNLVSWGAIISCFAQNGQYRRAIAKFKNMVVVGFFPNEFCYASVIRACYDGENFAFGLVVFGLTIKTGFKYNLCVGCGLIDMFVKGGNDKDSALLIFDDMPERNGVAWTLMITRCVQSGSAEEAIGLFLDMELDGFEPDQFCFTSVVSACTELESLKLGQQVHSRIIKAGLVTDVCVGCSLIDMYAKCSENGSMEDSRKVFDRLTKHNVMSWTAVISGYVQSAGEDVEALKLFCRMKHGYVQPNEYTYSSVLKACANSSDLETGEQIYAHVVKSGLAPCDAVGNALVSLYARSGKMDEAQKAFNSMFQKNLISYNVMVDGYVKSQRTDEAFMLAQEIDNIGIRPSNFTFSSLLSAAASLGAMTIGQQLHCQLSKSGLSSDPCVGNSLISMYSRCGNVEDAFKVFSRMAVRNLISWTSIIMGLAKHGYAIETLEIFDQMIESGIRPNEVTFIGVLSACGHAGLVDEGWEYFNSMSSSHGISPRMEHYACLVDLLGRSGCLEKALSFINSMPFEANALVWRALLSACRTHGNMEIGKTAAKRIVELEPDDSAAYVLLSNLYAACGLWDSVSRIRKRMKVRKLRKEAGCSWVEIHNQVHRFYVGDTSHPQSKEIYNKLGQLVSEIKELGYIPDTNFVLHDVEEELKEQYLLQHSEKIAVAFCVLNTVPGRPIRIFKNLRVCGDCHTALKFISMTTGREIIVRDTNRFHHIKDGGCSCRGYW
ncbi:pentatricopeptide repeat-containing protein At3g49170, chloroplastic [Nymphaea colorata]|uniref:DYW domain-containing protein n=1 Tax=Nymphaea colorata TaxID=210225 RepID=A0A5K0WDX4_9MAGN|nr:pentatricopeptide repeat-containing protein At3g49170, chloroplastic [Nymphaea colorata]